MIIVHSIIASLLGLLATLGPLLSLAYPDTAAAPAITAAEHRRTIEPRDFHDPAYLAFEDTDRHNAQATIPTLVTSPVRASQSTATVTVPQRTGTLETTAPEEIATSEPARESEFPTKVERWRPLVEEHFPTEWVDWALEIISCESHGIPAAVNPSTGARGLMQHLDRYWKERAAAAGWSGASSSDPEANIAVGAWLLADGGPSHWSCRAPQP